MEGQSWGLDDASEARKRPEEKAEVLGRNLESVIGAFNEIVKRSLHHLKIDKGSEREISATTAKFCLIERSKLNNLRQPKNPKQKELVFGRPRSEEHRNLP